MRRLSDIDLRLLRIFCTVVECGGFQGAQIALNMAQSTLSTHFSALESKLGTKLAQRGRAGFRLTVTGQATYEAAQALFRDLDRFTAAMGQVHGKQTRRLRIGIVDALSTFDEINLQKAIAAFSEGLPDVFLEVGVDTPSALLKGLVATRQDVIIGPFFQSLPGLDFRPLASEVHHLYCRKAHPWFDREDAEITRHDFLTVGFSVRSYMHLDDTYRLGRVTARAEVNSMEAQEIVILSGEYVGFLPSHRGKLWQKRGLMRPINTTDWSFKSQFFVAFDGQSLSASLARRFAELLSAVRGAG